AEVSSLDDVLPQTEIVEAADQLRPLQRGIPIVGRNERNGDWPLCFDVHVNAAPLRSGTIRTAGVIIRRIHTDRFIVSWPPIKNLALVLRKYRRCRAKQEPEDTNRSFTHGIIFAAGRARDNGTKNSTPRTSTRPNGHFECLPVATPASTLPRLA